MIRPASVLLGVWGLVFGISGCAATDQLAFHRHRADRRQMFQLYGDCLGQRRGELLTIAKFCESVADTRYTREKNAAIDRCPLSEYLPCSQP